MAKTINYSFITELPGLKATEEQISRLYQRYYFVRQFANNKDVLEVACGSGVGLGYLAEVAGTVIGVDIDEKNVNLVRKYYKGKDERGFREDKKLRRWEGDGNERFGRWEDEKQKIEDGSKNSEVRIQSTDKKCKIKVDLMDAHDLKFLDKSFDIVLLYEAMYYLKDPEKFVLEAERVLREDGKLIMCTVNKDWEDFHPSPYTFKYFSVPELYALLKSKFHEIEMYGSFRINDSGVKNKLISLIKRTAVKFNLIPGSLKARAYLKRVFMGRLVPLPNEVYEDMAPYEPPVPISIDKVNKDFKIIYAVARK